MRLLSPRLWLALALAAANLGADWPHVRGPAYDARSPEAGLAESWPAEGPPVLWSRELGPGYSAFVVAEGKAFTLYQAKTGMFLTALDADTGADVWRTRVDWPWQPGGMYPGPYASPTYSAGRVYYATPTGRVGCAASADGKSLWSIDVREKFGGQGTEFGFASSPLVQDGRVIMPVGGKGASMVALSAGDGSTLWAAGDDAASYCPALPITVDGRRQVVGFLRNCLVLHDPATGERVWRGPLSSNYDEHAAWPLFDGRHLLVASPFRAGTQVFRLSAAEGIMTGKPVWSGRQLSNDVCSSLLLDGSVFGFDLHQSQASTHRPSRGSFKCLDLATGRVRWETDAVGQATPLAADNKLVVWTEKGELLLARPNAERYEELARAKVLGGDGMCWAAPALSGRRLFVRDHSRAACVYLGPPSDLDPSRPVSRADVSDHGFDWSRLVPREPEFPNDAPTVADVGTWFLWCAGIFAAAGTLALTVRWLRPRYRFARLFGVTAFALGLCGTTAIGAWADGFVLTWPASLYVAFRAVVGFGANPSTSRRGRLTARLALAAFSGLCYGYYLLCVEVGFAMAWGFLLGFAPALPLAIIAAKRRSGPTRLIVEMLGFAVYFWASGLAPAGKAAMID